MKRSTCFWRGLVLGSLLLLQACGGTGTGNPGVGTEGPDTIGNSGRDNKSTAILTAICQKIQSCYSQSKSSQCNTSGLASTTLASKLGLTSGTSPFSAVISAEASGTLQANATAAIQCISDINALSCSSAPVSTAYNPASPQDYSQVEILVSTAPGSCPNVFAQVR